jgi:hypothetical protein
MVERFHKRFGFPTGSGGNLYRLCESFNKASKLTFSFHAQEKLDKRTDRNRIEDHIRILEFNPEQVFEFYQDTRGVSKACFRVPYTLKEDMTIVVSRELLIVTIYFNRKGDIHETLNPRIYRQLLAR